MKKKETYLVPQLITFSVRTEGVLCGSVRSNAFDEYEYEDVSSSVWGS